MGVFTTQALVRLVTDLLTFTMRPYSHGASAAWTEMQAKSSKATRPRMAPKKMGRERFISSIKFNRLRGSQIPRTGGRATLIKCQQKAQTTEVHRGPQGFNSELPWCPESGVC